MEILSKINKRMYVESSGLKCPFCGSFDFDCGRAEVIGGGARQDVTCKDCNASWTDLYTLTEIVNVGFPDEGC